jgi:hypothetical protein
MESKNLFSTLKAAYMSKLVQGSPFSTLLWVSYTMSLCLKTTHSRNIFLLKYFWLLVVWGIDIWLIVVTPSAISIMNFVTLYRFRRSIPGSVFSKTIFV